MKKIFYICLSLMMCMFASCQKDEDAAPEPQPQPEPEKPIVKYAEYETTDDYVDFGVGNFMIATKNLGGNWHIPTTEEFQELIDNCTFENVTVNGHTVMKATGPNGNYIYFPHTGTTKVIDEIYCWTSDLEPLANHHAVCYSIHSFWGTAFKTWEDRYAGLTIRAVCP